MKKSPKVYTELYALMLDGHILTPESFKEYWKNYGQASLSGLYGWRPAKKIYYTLGQAKAGLAHVPEQIKSKVEIHRFASAGKVADTETVLSEQKDRKAKKELAYKKRAIEWAEQNLRSKELELENLRKEAQRRADELKKLEKS
jgi:hypothetical protein